MITILLLSIFASVFITFIYTKLLIISHQISTEDEDYRNKIKRFAITSFIVVLIMLSVGFYWVLPLFLKQS